MLSGIKSTSHPRTLRELTRDGIEASARDRKIRDLKAKIDELGSRPQPQADTSSETDPAQAHDDLANGDDEMIKKLEARNNEVIAHEAAHVAAGGAYIKGSPTYTYQIGPDGKPYAIGGQVGIDLTPVPGNPRATIEKMEAVRAAATAPDEPSGQDANVAAIASRVEEQARAELARAAEQNPLPALRSAANSYAPPAKARGGWVNASA